MPITYEIRPAENLVAFVVVGDFTVEQFRSRWKEILASSLFRTEMDAVWDVRQGSLTSLTIDSMYAIRELIAAMSDVRGSNYKVAFVTGTEVDFGMARMLQITCDELPADVQVFREYDKALAWITEPVAAEPP